MELLKFTDDILLTITDQMTLASLYATFCTCRRFAVWSNSDEFWIRRAKVLFGVKPPDVRILIDNNPNAEGFVPTERLGYIVLHHAAQARAFPSKSRDIAPDFWRCMPLFFEGVTQTSLCKGLIETETFVDKFLESKPNPLTQHSPQLTMAVASRSKDIIVDLLLEYPEGVVVMIDMLRSVDLPWVYRRKLKKVIRKDVLPKHGSNETELSSAISLAITIIKGVSPERLNTTRELLTPHLHTRITTILEIFRLILLVDTLRRRRTAYQYATNMLHFVDMGPRGRWFYPFHERKEIGVIKQGLIDEFIYALYSS